MSSLTLTCSILVVMATSSICAIEMDKVFNLCQAREFHSFRRKVCSMSKRSVAPGEYAEFLREKSNSTQALLRPRRSAQRQLMDYPNVPLHVHPKILAGLDSILSRQLQAINNSSPHHTHSKGHGIQEGDSFLHMPDFHHLEEAPFDFHHSLPITDSEEHIIYDPRDIFSHDAYDPEEETYSSNWGRDEVMLALGKRDDIGSTVGELRKQCCLHGCTLNKHYFHFLSTCMTLN